MSLSEYSIVIPLGTASTVTIPSSFPDLGSIVKILLELAAEPTSSLPSFDTLIAKGVANECPGFDEGKGRVQGQ